MTEQKRNRIVGVFYTKEQLVKENFDFDMCQYTAVDKRNAPTLVWKVTFNMAIAYVESVEKYLIIDLEQNQFLNLEKVSLN